MAPASTAAARCGSRCAGEWLSSNNRSRGHDPRPHPHCWWPRFCWRARGGFPTCGALKYRRPGTQVASRQRTPAWLRVRSGAPRRRVAADHRRVQTAIAVTRILRQDYDAAAHAMAYASPGAAAISVLTEPTFFDGSLDDLQRVRARVSTAAPAQGLHRRPATRCSRRPSRRGRGLAHRRGARSQTSGAVAGARRGSAGSARWSRSTSAVELARAADAGATVIGVNSRDLRTLASIRASTTIVASAPPRDDRRGGERHRLDCGSRSSGARRLRAFLVGERLITRPDPGAALRQLRGAPSDLEVRSCDARQDLRRHDGSRMRCSPRNSARRRSDSCSGLTVRGYIEPLAAADNRGRVAAIHRPVGVFVNQPIHRARDCALRSPRRGAVARRRDTRGVRGAAGRVIKAMPLRDATDGKTAADVPSAAMVLLDAHDPVRRGGTGRPIDWSLASAVARGPAGNSFGRAQPAERGARQLPRSGRTAWTYRRASNEARQKDPAKLGALFAALREP